MARKPEVDLWRTGSNGSEVQAYWRVGADLLFAEEQGEGGERIWKAAEAAKRVFDDAELPPRADGKRAEVSFDLENVEVYWSSPCHIGSTAEDDEAALKNDPSSVQLFDAGCAAQAAFIESWEAGE